jgi:RNAse (barnase) inhibitor barstar
VALLGKFPWLTGLGIIGVDDEHARDFADALKKLGFDVIEIEGSDQHDAESFWAEMVRAFDLPEWCGHSLNSVDDCWVDRAKGISRVAIVWHSAARAAANVLLHYSEGIAWLLDAERKFFMEGRQFEIILSAAGPGFDRPG